jgi:eukaryotic-like serine/threonine-protein kinase
MDVKSCSRGGERGSHLYLKNADGSGREELLLESSHAVIPNAWSPDRRRVVFTSTEVDTRHNLWVLPLDGARKPYTYLQTRFSEQSAAFSPDGKWLAFISDQSGTEGVYAARFPQSDMITRISTGGAGFPSWSRDGRLIRYFDVPELRVVETNVQTSNDKVVVGATRPLIEYRRAGRHGRAFDVSPDGDRIVAVRAAGADEPEQMHLLVNWLARVKQ